MAKKKATTAKDMTRWADVPAEVILAVSEICDGHGILQPAALRKLGVPKTLVAAYTQVLVSDFTDPKRTIFDNKTGQPVKSVKGVYGLDLLRDIVRQLGLGQDCGDFFGRGRAAQEYKRVIAAHFVPQQQEG